MQPDRDRKRSGRKWGGLPIFRGQSSATFLQCEGTQAGGKRFWSIETLIRIRK
jgi:hypothetical protein